MSAKELLFCNHQMMMMILVIKLMHLWQIIQDKTIFTVYTDRPVSRFATFSSLCVYECFIVYIPSVAASVCRCRRH